MMHVSSTKRCQHSFALLCYFFNPNFAIKKNVLINFLVDAIKNSTQPDIVYSDHSIKQQKCIEIIGALNYFILLLSFHVGQKTNNKKAYKKTIICSLFISNVQCKIF